MLKNHVKCLIFILLTCVACDTSDVIFEQNRAIEGNMWHKDNKIVATIPITDTIQYYDLQLYVRNNNNYPYSNLYMFVTITAPTGAMVTDTVHYKLANDQGEWLGKGFSQLWDNRFPFRDNIRFPAKGNYNVEIRHGMRDEELTGITDVGVRLLQKQAK